MPPALGDPANVFDTFVEDYEAACDRGLRLSGESRDYFARRRIALTREFCSGWPVTSIVDFGCGLGHATPYLLDAFDQARVIGIDTASEAVRAAREQYVSPRVTFFAGESVPEELDADLVYTNGVFHHIEPSNRGSEALKIFGWMKPGGRIALWENNPWNPGTRAVMNRIPFDRDAHTLSYLDTEFLLRNTGLRLLRTSFHFYFPSWLKGLRRWERMLERLPLGGQYCVFAEKPAL